MGNDDSVRLTYDFELFKGVSVQLKDISNAEETAFRISQAPAVKKVWPVHIYDRPDTEFQTVNPMKLESRDESDTIGPHVMMQVDKMREKGFTGKGVKVAVIDSGVSLTDKKKHASPWTSANK